MKTRPKDRLSAWIRHLIIWRWMAISIFWRRLRLDKANKFVRFEPLPTEKRWIISKPFFRFIRPGKTRPLPFFPATSLAYQTEIAKAADSETEVSIGHGF